MNIRFLSGGLCGVDAFPVEVEVDYARQGLPGFNMVGLPEAEVRESRDRVMAAIRASNFRLPPARITVNLAPAGRRKTGAGYDLPLALGLLAGAGVLDPSIIPNYFFAAELSLSGQLKPVLGILPLAILAHRQNSPGLVISPANAGEGAVVAGLNVYAPATLEECVNFLRGETLLQPFPAPVFEMDRQANHGPVADFAEVKGQQTAKRALEIAAAGNHNVLLIGPRAAARQCLPKDCPEFCRP